MHSLEEQILACIDRRLLPKVKIRIPHFTSVLVLDVEVEEQTSQNHLDLIGSKEPAGTRMPSIAEHQVLLVGRDELVARVVGRCARLSQLVRPEAVEVIVGVGDGVVIRVLVYGVRSNLNFDARGNVLAVRECEATEDFARERGETYVLSYNEYGFCQMLDQSSSPGG